MIKPGEKFYRVVEDAPVAPAQPAAGPTRRRANTRRMCHERGDLGGGSGRRPRHPLRRAAAQAVQAGGQILLAHTLDALLAHRPWPGQWW